MVKNEETNSNISVSSDKKLILLKEKVDSRETVDLVYDPETDVEYWKTNNGIELRRNTDGSPFTKTRPNIFKEVLPEFIIGGVSLLILMIIGDIFTYFNNKRAAFLVWLFFFIVAIIVIYLIQKTIKTNSVILPPKEKKAWKYQILKSNILLIVLIAFLAYIFQILEDKNSVNFMMNLIKDIIE